MKITKANLLYFQFLQTVAAFIVKAVKIDSNKDGKISVTEITSFFISSVVPLLTNYNNTRDQFNAFFNFMKTITFDKFKGALLDLVEEDLLPEELQSAEAKVDKIAQAIYNLIMSVEETIEAFKDVFGGKVLVIEMKDK